MSFTPCHDGFQGEYTSSSAYTFYKAETEHKENVYPGSYVVSRQDSVKNVCDCSIDYFYGGDSHKLKYCLSLRLQRLFNPLRNILQMVLT